MMNIQVYFREDGSSPFLDWLLGLDPAAVTRVTNAQARLAMGNTSNVKWFSGIGEFKINWGPGYRIYLAQDGKDLIILLVGGTKKDQQADIAQALLLHQEYQQRKKQDQQNRDQSTQNKPKQANQKKRRKRK